MSESPGGIKNAALLAKISQASPETPKKSIYSAIWNLDREYPEAVSKPDRGLLRSKASEGEEPTAPSPTKETAFTANKIQESDFYEPFAQWLMKDLNEVNDAASLGGAAMKSKWGTPDVIGVYKPLFKQLIKFPLEIVSAELKIDPQNSIVAFGQAIAYRLFSAKTCIVMPTTLAEEDKSRLESLSMLFGAGFVLFDLDPVNPQFVIRVRAQRFLPDMFYVNEFAERLNAYDAQLFEHLFGH